MTVVSVYAVFADKEQAERIARNAVEDRLAACANMIGPIRSIYRWKDAVETADEVAVLFKTTDADADALMTRIAGLHSYEVPCIVTWPIDKILGPYAAWVEENVA